VPSYVQKYIDTAEIVRDGRIVAISDKSYKKECPIKRNVKRKIFPIGSMPPLVSAFSPTV